MAGVSVATLPFVLADYHGIELPMTEQVHSIPHLDTAQKDAIRAIMERPVAKR
jgi:glycerol-3-phosphate dehydrogenase